MSVAVGVREAVGVVLGVGEGPGVAVRVEVGVREGVGVGPMVGVREGVSDAATVGMGVDDGVALGSRVTTGVRVGVAELVAVGLGPTVGASVPLEAGVALADGFGVSVGTTISTEPSIPAPSTPRPDVSPKDGAGESEKSTSAVVVTCGCPAIKVIVTRTPSGIASSGGTKSAITMSISASPSFGSKMTEPIWVGGRSNTTASGNPSPSASVSSNSSHVWS